MTGMQQIFYQTETEKDDSNTSEVMTQLIDSFVIHLQE